MALNAYQTLINQTANKRALSGEEQERLRQIAAQQGAAAASSAYLANQNAQQTAMPDYVAASKAKSAANQAIVNGATAGQSVQTQNAYQKALANAQPNVNVSLTNRNATSGNPVSPAVQAALGTPQPAAAQPVVQSRDYLIFGNPAEGFKSGMSAEDQASWNAIGQKYAAGDTSWNRDTNQFREDGNWSSFYDDNGNINGWLYAGDGLGGYAPAFGGKIGESGYKAGTVFYSPDGKAYTMGADGTLTQSGNVEWAKYGSYVGPKAGYQDSSFWALEDGQYKRYTNQTAPDDVLEAQGYYRDSNGLVMPINDQYRISQAVKNGDITPEQAALAQAMQNGNPGNMPSASANTPSSSSGSSYSGSVTTTPTSPAPNYQTVQPQPVQTQPTQPPYQAAIDEWSYGPAPEWNGTDYERQRDEALAAAGEKWQGSEYQPLRDAALRRAEEMQWNYDPNTDPVWQALQKQYRREGDRATQEALAQAAMRTGGLANSYAVTAASQAGDYYAAQLSDRLPQLYQDAYQRYLSEFQRQMGISDQYQGFDDREYSRWADQQGRNFDLADRYNQYGNTEYQRYLDQLGQYNTDRSFDYGRYRDRIGDARYADETAYNRQRDAISDQRYDQEWAQQRREYADQQNWKATEWQQYLREYGDQLSEKERQWAYQMARDAVSDQQYADQTAWNRATYGQEYADSRADTEWEQGYKDSVFQNQVKQQDIDNAWARIKATGYISEEDAALLGIRPGEYTGSLTTGSKSTGGGGGDSGSGGSGNGNGNGYDYAGTGGGSEGGYTGDAKTVVKGVIHDTNAEPMTTGFKDWWPTLRDAFDAGASSQELAQAIDTLYRNGIIAEYEIDVLLDKLGLDAKSGMTQKVHDKIYDTKQAAKRAKSGDSAIDNLTSRIKSKIAEAKSKNGG